MWIKGSRKSRPRSHHDKYIDLQVPLSGDEYFGVKPRKECGEAKDINAGNDIMFFDDPVTETVHVKAGDSITFALTPPTPRSSGPGASKRPSSRSRSCEDVKNQRLDDQSISMAAGRIFRKRQICPAVFRLGSDFPDTKSFTRVVLIPSSSASCF